MTLLSQHAFGIQKRARRTKCFFVVATSTEEKKKKTKRRMRVCLGNTGMGKSGRPTVHVGRIEMTPRILREMTSDSVIGKCKILPSTITIGDKYGPAMAITEQAEADEYFALCVEHTMNCLIDNRRDDGQFKSAAATREEAEQIERMNLGYFAGYYDSETRARVERLFLCSHPVFGAIAENGPPTTEGALFAGFRAALKK